MQPLVESFFHEPTATLTHLVYDATGGEAVVIDAVLDYEQRAGRLGTASADRVVDFARSQKLQVRWVLETHAHADHVSAGAYLRDRLGAKLGIGAGITRVQATFKKIFNLGDEFSADGSQFDRLFQDGERFRVGSLDIEVVGTPGHTNDSVTYLIGDAAFIGDTLFAADTGSARCDFPGGDAHVLYRSVQRLFSLPDATRMFLCHDYPPNARAIQNHLPVAQQRAHNVHINEAVGEAQFVAMRTARDATLELPNLILPSIQLNIRAGRKPPPEPNGVAYLKIPLDLMGKN